MKTQEGLNEYERAIYEEGIQAERKRVCEIIEKLFAGVYGCECMECSEYNNPKACQVKELLAKINSPNKSDKCDAHKLCFPKQVQTGSDTIQKINSEKTARDFNLEYEGIK